MDLDDLNILQTCPNCGGVEVGLESFVSVSYNRDGLVRLTFACPKCGAHMTSGYQVSPVAASAIVGIAMKVMDGSDDMLQDVLDSSAFVDVPEMCEFPEATAGGNLDELLGVELGGGKESDGDDEGGKDGGIKAEGGIDVNDSGANDGNNDGVGIDSDNPGDDTGNGAGGGGNDGDSGGLNIQYTSLMSDPTFSFDVILNRPYSPDNLGPGASGFGVGGSVAGSTSGFAGGSSVVSADLPGSAPYAPSDEDLARLEYFHRQLEHLDTVDEAIDEIDTGYNLRDDDENEDFGDDDAPKSTD